VIGNLCDVRDLLGRSQCPWLQILHELQHAIGPEPHGGTNPRGAASKDDVKRIDAERVKQRSPFRINTVGHKPTTAMELTRIAAGDTRDWYTSIAGEGDEGCFAQQSILSQTVDVT